MDLVRTAEHPHLDVSVCSPDFQAHISLVKQLRRSLGEFSSKLMEDDVMDPSTTLTTSTHRPTFAAMSRLIVGNPFDVTSPESIKAWRELEAKFAIAKSRGIKAISADIWWGLIEPRDGVFDFTYSDRMLQAIKSVGLQWVVLHSMHQCGGNVGDGTNDVPLPRHVWDILASRTPSGLVSDVQYVSEFGNQSVEYVSCWAIRGRCTEGSSRALYLVVEHISLRRLAASLVSEVAQGRAARARADWPP